MIEITNEEELTSVPFAVVDFWSPTCGPCRQMRPILESLEKVFPKVKFFGCNILSGGALAQKYGVEMLPTIIILKNGRSAYRNTGVIRCDILAETIDELMESGYSE